jgi:uncharacterized protein
MVEPLTQPWMVAVWPGMGGVAQIAGAHLVRELRAERAAAIDGTAFFEPTAVTVKSGLLGPKELPQSAFYAWRDPNRIRDLLVLIAEEQPASGLRKYMDALLAVAALHGVRKLVTFAAMATPMHPAARPRVFGAATRPELVRDLERDEVTLLREGEISGLNGVFLSAAASRGIPGLCLLGEFPYFASSIVHPGAAAAVLRAFTRLSGIFVDDTELVTEGAKVQQALVRFLERAKQSAEEVEEDETEDLTGLEAALDAEQTAAAPEPERKETPITPELEARIDEMFHDAERDRDKAMELKAELDRRGLFHRFEDRFLDLFRKAG